MKKALTLLIILFVSANLCLFAQNKNHVQQKQPAPQQQQQTTIILKPVFQVQDIIFALNALASIEIQGNEVDPFLACKSILQKSYQAVQQANLKADETATVEIQLPVAQNMLSFLGRAKFTGAYAERYKSFVTAIVESAKPYQQQNQAEEK